MASASRSVSAKLLACLFSALMVACSSIPEVPVAAGSRVVVRLYDAQAGIELGLANESHPELAGVYSRRREDANLKLAKDQLIGQLLASLENAGLSEFSREGAPEELQGTQSYLFVVEDARLRCFDAPGGSDSEEERIAYSRIKLIMNEYYRHIGGAQFVDNPDGASMLRNQRVKGPQ